MLSAVLGNNCSESGHPDWNLAQCKGTQAGDERPGLQPIAIVCGGCWCPHCINACGLCWCENHSPANKLTGTQSV